MEAPSRYQGTSDFVRVIFFFFFNNNRENLRRILFESLNVTCNMACVRLNFIFNDTLSRLDCMVNLVVKIGKIRG